MRATLSPTVFIEYTKLYPVLYVALSVGPNHRQRSSQARLRVTDTQVPPVYDTQVPLVQVGG
jgi:hypothetical protein